MNDEQKLGLELHALVTKYALLLPTSAIMGVFGLCMLDYGTNALTKAREEAENE